MPMFFHESATEMNVSTPFPSSMTPDFEETLSTIASNDTHLSTIEPMDSGNVSTNDPTPFSTTTGRAPVLPDEGGKADDEDNYYFRTAELGIPFALTAAIVVGKNENSYSIHVFPNVARCLNACNDKAMINIEN